MSHLMRLLLLVSLVLSLLPWTTRPQPLSVRRAHDPAIAANVVSLVRQAFATSSPAWYRLLLGSEPFSGSEVAQAQLICTYFSVSFSQGPMRMARDTLWPCRAYARAMVITSLLVSLYELPYAMVVNKTQPDLVQDCVSAGGQTAMTQDEYKILVNSHMTCLLGLPQVYQ